MFRSINPAGPFFKNAFGPWPKRNSVLASGTGFAAADARESIDDLQWITSGTYSLINNWVDGFGVIGWQSPWLFGFLDYTWCNDDFTSYANGNYATLSGGTGWLSNWAFAPAT